MTNEQREEMRKQAIAEAKSKGLTGEVYFSFTAGYIAGADYVDKNILTESLLREKGIPEHHIKEAIEIVLMHMERKDSNINDAIEFTIKWIDRADKP